MFCQNSNEINVDVLTTYFLLPKVIRKLFLKNAPITVIEAILNNFKASFVTRENIFDKYDYYPLKAHLSYLKQEEGEFKMYLFKHLIHSKAIKKYEDWIEDMNRASNTYNLDIPTFFKKYLDNIDNDLKN